MSLKQEPESCKIARELYFERRDLYKKRSSLGWFTIPKRQKGWIAQFRLRDDVLRSKDAEAFKIILPYVQNYQLSRTTYFSRLGELHLKSIPEYKRKNITFPEYYWNKYFMRTLDYDVYHYWGTASIEQFCYKIIRRYIFEIEVRKHYITQVPIIDPAIESRLKEINNFVKTHSLKGQWGKKLNYYNDCGCDYCTGEAKNHELEAIYHKELREELNL